MKKLLLVSLCFLVLFMTQVHAQNRTITGTVTSKDDELALPGVAVTVTGTTVGTVTNINGKYTLQVPASAKTLTFAYIGFESQTIKIEKNEVDVVLNSSTTSLSEVVVTAGGLTVTKGSQGYATTQIKPDELTAGKAFNVGSALSGKAAGLQVSTISAGLNPTVRIVLRGDRSLLGNNQALLVLDNIIVPNSLLGNMNPEDIADIQILNGGQGAALYGVDASNGVIIITTKKGNKGAPQVRFSQTVSGEHVSFLPKLQTGFGSGTQAEVQEYLPTENQQFGPAFDGSQRIVGYPLVDGSIQVYPYQYNNSKDKFWQTATGKQTDFSINAGDDKSSTYVAGQYYTKTGVIPGDNYNRVSIRANGSRTLPNHITISYTANYLQNRYDQTSAAGTIYNNMEQTPGQVNVTNYKDVYNNPFASINGFYNFFYNNPYFTAVNNRQTTRNDILTGSAEVNYDPFKFLNFTFRTGLTSTNATSKTTVNKYTPTPYTVSLATYGETAGGSVINPNVGSVDDADSYSTQITAEFYATFKKQLKDFNVSVTAATSLRQNKGQNEDVNVTGLLEPDLFNVSARTPANLLGSESQYITRNQAVYGVVNVGYKGYLNLHVTGRNDWLSILPVQNYSFFYPAADVSFIPTEAINALKNNPVLSSLKIRAGISKVGNANLGSNNNGAYSLIPTFSSGAGYPYPTGPGYNQGNILVSPSLQPESTRSYEFGADADLYNGRLSGSITYYHSATTGQTVQVNISGATGFTGYLLNTGELDNQGIETSLNIVPIKTTTGWQLTLGGNFTWLDNKVISLPAGLSSLPIGNGTYAVPGHAYPELEGTDYNRDSQGRVIVNAKTGYPSATSSNTNLIGNTQPKQRLGLNFELRYKTLRLSATAEYRGGFVVQSSVSESFDFSGAGARSAYYNRERFVFPNSSYLDPAGSGNYIANNNITVVDGGQSFWSSGPLNTSETTNYVYSGASWRLREATLSWDVPKNLLNHQKYVKGATVSIQGRNLLLWVPKSNLYTDPEFTNTDSNNGNAAGVNSVSQTPPTRYYGATLSLIF